MDTSPDRRQFERRPFQACVTISLPTPQAAVKAHALGISPDGVRLICADHVSEGADALLIFRMRTRRGVQIEEVPGRVIHVHMDDDAWVVEVKFNQVLDRQSTPLLAQAATSGDT
jgi:hypothetical protein